MDDDIREAFKVFDMVRYSLLHFSFVLYLCMFQDGNGFITRTELTYAIENIGLNMSKDEVEVEEENFITRSLNI